MDLSREFLGDLFGVLRVEREDNLVALSGKNGANQIADCLFVFDQQDNLAGATFEKRNLFRYFRFDLLIHTGQINLERAAFSRFAVHPDVATALLDDSVDGREPQSSAASALFGGEEGLENVCDCSGIH